MLFDINTLKGTLKAFNIELNEDLIAMMKIPSLTDYKTRKLHL